MNYLDLQLFAGVQSTETGSPNADTSDWGGTGLSAENKIFYDTELIRQAGSNLVHAQFGQRKTIPPNGGKTIEFRKFAPLVKAVTPLSEGVTPSGNSTNVQNITATLNQYGDFIVHSDLLELTAIDNVILEDTELLGEQAGATLDTIVRNELNAGTVVSYCPKISSGSETEVTARHLLDKTAKLTVDAVKRAATKLKAQNAPKFDGCYVAIIHPYAAYDLMSDEKWVDVHKYASVQNIFEGEIGKIAGVRFVESTEAKVFCGADLASDSRTLKVNLQAGYAAATEIAFDSGTVSADSLIGRYVIINGTKAKVTDNTASTLTLDTAVTCADNAVIYPGEGGADGLAVFSTLFLGKNAYGVVDIAGGGLEVIIKQKGSAGTADPLNQRSSVGWKALTAAKILVQKYLVRVESCSAVYSESTAAN